MPRLLGVTLIVIKLDTLYEGDVETVLGLVLGLVLTAGVDESFMTVSGSVQVPFAISFI